MPPAGRNTLTSHPLRAQSATDASRYGRPEAARPALVEALAAADRETIIHARKRERDGGHGHRLQPAPAGRRSAVPRWLIDSLRLRRQRNAHPLPVDLAQRPITPPGRPPPARPQMLPDGVMERANLAAPDASVRRRRNHVIIGRRPMHKRRRGSRIGRVLPRSRHVVGVHAPDDGDRRARGKAVNVTMDGTVPPAPDALRI